MVSTFSSALNFIIFASSIVGHVFTLPLTQNGVRQGNGAELDESDIVYRRCIQNGTIALTFDDGPQIEGNDTTDKLLDLLSFYNVKATFFVIGLHVSFDNDTTQAVLKRMVREGHSVGSHTWSHPDLVKHTEGYIIAQMDRLSDKLYEVINERPTIMRPPYGNYNKHVIDVVNGQLGYKLILWSIDTRDWAHQSKIDKSLEKYEIALEGKNPEVTQGHIALHHDIARGSVELASMVIEYGRSKGYRFVSLNECLGL